MGFQRAGTGPIALPPEMVALIEERAREEGISAQEALTRCLAEWRTERDRARKVPPPSTTDREHSPGSRANSDRAGTDTRD